MIAAIYARKSTEQNAVADDQKSVTRQIDHARTYAIAKGWTVADECIFVDDGISGAEFENRPGFVALLKALKPAPFTILIVSELSRLGREQLETGYALKRLSVAGVRVFTYLDDREVTLDTATDKFMMSAGSFGAELEREKSRQRGTDAMHRKARAGHCCGGRLFGYDNVEVRDATGKRSHVVNRINPSEAAVVRQIFELAATGNGVKTIAKTLNAAGLAAPRPQQRRPRGWAPSSVYEILRRDIYRGVRVWNKSKKRDAWGKRQQCDRPSTEWVTIPAEDLRIVTDDLWNAVRERARIRTAIGTDYHQGKRPDLRDGRGVRRQYFLAGFGVCAACGGSMQVVSRASGGGRTFRYVCGTYWNRGTAICANGRMVEMSVADAALRELLRTEVLRPSVVEPVFDRALEMLEDDQQNDRARRSVVERAIGVLDSELANLADTAAKGGAVPAVLEALAQRDQERRRLKAELARLTQGPLPNSQAPARRAMMRALLGDWEALLAGNAAEARPLLDIVLAGRIAFRAVPATQGRGRYELTVPIAFDRVMSTVIPELSLLQDRMASPTGPETAGIRFQRTFRAA